MEPLTDNQTGVLYYQSKPDNCRVATKNDFIQGGMIKIGMPYLILGYHWEVYQVYRVNRNFKFDVNVGPWMKDGRVFVAVNS